MVKTLRKFAWTFACVSLVFFASCSDGNDDTGGGSGNGNPTATLPESTGTNELAGKTFVIDYYDGEYYGSYRLMKFNESDYTYEYYYKGSNDSAYELEFTHKFFYTYDGTKKIIYSAYAIPEEELKELGYNSVDEYIAAYKKELTDSGVSNEDVNIYMNAMLSSKEMLQYVILDPEADKITIGENSYPMLETKSAFDSSDISTVSAYNYVYDSTINNYSDVSVYCGMLEISNGEEKYNDTQDEYTTQNYYCYLTWNGLSFSGNVYDTTEKTTINENGNTYTSTEKSENIGTISGTAEIKGNEASGYTLTLTIINCPTIDVPKFEFKAGGTVTLDISQDCDIKDL